MKDDSVQYLMHKFPRLKILSLNDKTKAANGGASDDDDDESDDDTATQRPQTEYQCMLNPMLMVQFFKYLTKMRYFNIQYCFPGEKLVNVVKRYIHLAASPNNKKKLALDIRHSSNQPRSNYPNMRIF